MRSANFVSGFSEVPDTKAVPSTSTNSLLITSHIQIFFAHAAKLQGYYDGTHWGKDFLLLEDTQGINFNISDGRIQLNVPLRLHDTRKAMIYVNQTIVGGSTSVRLENVHGYFRPTDGGVGVFAKEGRTNFSAAASQIRDATALFEDYRQKKSVSQMAHEVIYRANKQFRDYHLETSIATRYAMAWLLKLRSMCRACPPHWSALGCA